MRRALVVYESVFGNTRSIAGAVAEGIATALPAQVVEARDAGAALDSGVALLVVGAPTHAFGLPRLSTRSSASQHGEAAASPPATTGVREWLARLEGPAGLPAAAFCTLVDRPAWLQVIGSADKGIRAALSRLRFAMVSPPARFQVTGMAGPLVAGELDRAREWGAELGKAACHHETLLASGPVATTELRPVA